MARSMLRTADFTTPDQMVEGYYAEHTYEVNGYLLTRHQISVVGLEESSSISLTFAYHATDTETN